LGIRHGGGSEEGRDPARKYHQFGLNNRWRILKARSSSSIVDALANWVMV
jgi:hypothetical protein